MDKILEKLQNKAFHLSDKMFDFLSHQYHTLVEDPVPDLKMNGFHPEIVRKVISFHRKQFFTDEYIKSRILNPTTGTLDHIHAEITACTAIKLGKKNGNSEYPLVLLRVAAHFHDSDRSFPDKMITGEEKVRHDLSAYREYKKRHAANSASRMNEIFQKSAAQGCFYPAEFVKDLTYLILRHELGGEKHNGINKNIYSEIEPRLNLNDMTDIITNADSLAYFYANILTNWEECGKKRELLGNKVHFMYDRMTLNAKDDLQNSILKSTDHILGSFSDEKDANSIREILLEICI